MANSYLKATNHVFTSNDRVARNCEIFEILNVRINNECIKNREARIGIDLVKDEVENSLEREVENIKTYQQRMQKMLARVNQQIETNHSMQDKLHGDLEHKDMALEIDRDCAEMHNDAIDIKHHDGIEEEDVSGSVPQSWAKFSKNNVEESQCKS